MMYQVAKIHEFNEYCRASKGRHNGYYNYLNGTNQVIDGSRSKWDSITPYVLVTVCLRHHKASLFHIYRRFIHLSVICFIYFNLVRQCTVKCISCAGHNIERIKRNWYRILSRLREYYLHHHQALGQCSNVSVPLLAMIKWFEPRRPWFVANIFMKWYLSLYKVNQFKHLSYCIYQLLSTVNNGLHKLDCQSYLLW